MLKISSKVNLINILTLLARRALRKGLWYKILSSEERILTIMVSKYVKIVKNPELAATIARIIGKLFKTLNIGFKHAKAWADGAKAHGWNTSTWFEQDVIKWFELFANSRGAWI